MLPQNGFSICNFGNNLVQYFHVGGEMHSVFYFSETRVKYTKTNGHVLTKSYASRYKHDSDIDKHQVRKRAFVPGTFSGFR